MSNGEKFAQDFRGHNNYKLLDAQDLTYAGEWLEISNDVSASIGVTDLESGGSVTIHTSTLPEPASISSYDGKTIATISGAITATAENITDISSNLPVGWIKVKKTQGGTPATTTVCYRGLSR